MAQLKLNSATSVVDYLKSVNQPSDFSSRKQLYNQMGLKDRLGEYVGSSFQNPRFLTSLREKFKPAISPAPITPTPISPTSGLTRTPGTVGQELTERTSQDRMKFLQDRGLTVTPTIPESITTQPETTETMEIAATSEPKALTAESLGIPKPITAQEVLASIRQPSLESITRLPEVQLAEEAKTQSLTDLERAQKAGIKETQETFGRRGLFFSGARLSAEEDVKAEALSKRLGIEQNFAGILLKALQAETEKTTKDIEKIITDAQKGRESAIEQVNKAGFAVMPGGQIVPTAEALQKAEQAAKPIEISPGATLYDPVSGRSIFTAPAKTANDLLSPNEAATLGVPYGTSKTDAAQLGIIPKEQLTTQQKIDLEVKLADNFEKYVKESRQSAIQIKNIEDAFNEAQVRMNRGESINAASQGVLVTFQKLLDPASVVRESEYARSAAGLSLLGRIEGFVTKLRQGGAGLTAKDLKEFVDAGKLFLQNHQDQQLIFARRVQTQSRNYGLNIENILTPDILDMLGGGDIDDLRIRAKNLGFSEQNVQGMFDNGYSSSQIKQILDLYEQSKKKVSNTLVENKIAGKGTLGRVIGSIEDGLKALAAHESKNNAQVVGDIQRITATKFDPAIGKYQILVSSWKDWAKKAGIPQQYWNPLPYIIKDGNKWRNTIPEKIQDQVAMYQFRRYYDQANGDLAKAILRWNPYGGQEYVNKVLKNLPKEFIPETTRKYG